MSVRFPLTCSTWDDRELAAIQSVMDSGRYTMGPCVERFESSFAAYVGSRHAVMVNSGSSANLLMVAALMFRSTQSLQPGDEVLVPAVSWSTTYSPVTQYGLKLRFVDIDPLTLNYNLSALEASVSSRTRAIMVVNLLGNPNDFDAVLRIANSHNLIVIEDNCESLGARFNGKHCGTFGAMGSYSTFYSHHICTMEGGVVVTDDAELHEILLSLRAHGWTRELPQESLIAGRRSDDLFQEAYRFILPGYNVRPIEMFGAIGLEQLLKLPGFIEQRRLNAAILQEALGDHEDVMLQSETGQSSWFGFSLIVRPESPHDRAWLRQRLESAGFEVRPIVAGNFLRNEALRWMDHAAPVDTPGADLVHDRGLFIGNHHVPMSVAISELERVLRA